MLLAEHDIFGEAVSDSEDEDQNINILELEEENSRLTAEDSRLSDSGSLHVSAKTIIFLILFHHNSYNNGIIVNNCCNLRESVVKANTKCSSLFRG